MNHLIYNTSGEIQYAPDFNDTYISLKKCDVCECDIDSDLTATVKEANWTVCIGCLKMINLSEQFPDSTSFEMQEIISQLKPIL